MFEHRWILSLFLIAIIVSDCRADESNEFLPPRIVVDGQPLGANLRRVVSAMKLLGTPFSDEISTKLELAADDRDSIALQDLVDANVSFVVQINPEERVKVQRGPQLVNLQQHGFRPLLAKVLNDSTSTKRLRVVSPQGGAVYAGVAKLSMQRQQSLELIANENTNRESGRFLAVEMFDSPPMTDRLSGLRVEYAIALVLSTESGQREITVGFDLGRDEQDLGFRGEVSLLVPVRPALRVRLSILDQDRLPTTASLIIRDRAGHVYPLQPKRLAPDFFFQPQVYRADGETLLLPPGEFTVQSGRGPEYVTREQTVRIRDSFKDLSGKEQVDSPILIGKADKIGTDPGGLTENRIDVRLERWVNPMAYGFFSGDHHIHAAGCAHYTSPTEGVVPEDMFRQVKGEGLNVGCVLTWGPCYGYQRQFFAPKPHDVSERLTILKYDLEISGFGSQALGHVCLLNLNNQTYPGSEGTETRGWPTWTTPVLRWAKAQGGVTGYAHAASGLEIDPAAAAKRMLTRFDQNGDGRLSETEAQSALLPEAFEKIDSDHDQRIDESELTASHDRVADQLPNLAVPEMNGVGAMEICVATAEGVCDFISAMDTPRIQEWNMWYHILNCGFPLKVSGETDFPCMSSRRVGQGRVYVNLFDGTRSAPIDQAQAIKQLDFTEWCEGLAKGRSYVSDGFAHALDFHVNGVRPGYGDVQLAGSGTVTVKAMVCFAPETPVGVAYGTEESNEALGRPQRRTMRPQARIGNSTGSDGSLSGRRLIGDTVLLHGPRREAMVQGGDRLIEIVVNGQVVQSRKIDANGTNHDLMFEVPIDRSSWVSLRSFPQLHTNPVNVIVGGKSIRASKSSPRWCEQTIERLWQNREKNIVPSEREEARLTFERAKARFRQLVTEAD